jgi:multiple sugar transport system substrate-binding protein
MIMKKRMLIVMFAIMLCVLAIPAFATGKSESTAAKAEPASMRISWWGTQSRHNHFLAVVDLFEKAYPNAQFEPVFTGWAGYWEKMAAEVAGNNAPDIMAMDYNYIGQYVSNNLLADLSRYRGGLLDLSDVSEAVLGSGSMGGKLYGIAIATNTDSAFMYNPEIFAKAGLSEPKDDWTWQDFMDITNQIHERLGIYGTGTITDSIGYKTVAMWLRQHGAHLYTADGSALGYSDDKLIADYLQMLLSLSKSGAMQPIDTWSEHNVQQSYLITLKQAAFQPLSSNGVVASSQAAGTTFKLAFFPGPKNEAAQYVKPSAMWTMSRTGKHPEEAVKFISFFTNNIEAQKIVNAEMGVPISAKVRDAMISSLSPEVQVMFDFMTRLAKHCSPIDPPAPAGGAQVQDLFTRLTQEVLYERTTPTEAATRFRAEATRILAAK